MAAIETSDSDHPNLVASILSDRSQPNPSLRWIDWLTRARTENLSPRDLRILHTSCFSDRVGPVPIWFPAMSTTATNTSDWASDLGLKTFDEFHRWSVDHRDQFWQQAVARLGIRFHTNSETTLDLSQGPAKAAWFPDAKLNIAQSCFQAADDSTAIIAQCPNGPMRTWTVGELKRNASRVANGLVDAGFKVGDAIGVFMPMTDWSVAIYLGIVMAGCHVVSIADSFAAPEIATRLRIAKTKAVFTYDHQVRAGKQLPLFRRLAEASDCPAIVLSQNDILEVDLRNQDYDWDEFLSARSEFEAVIASPQETINVLFSSGTTGEPKAIPWNHLTPIKCAIDGYCHQNLAPGDVCAWPTNLGWMMGPWLIFASLINRATIALYEDAPMGASFGKFVQDAKVTMLGVVPTIVKAWQNSGEMEAFDWSNIKVFSSTGESSQVQPMTYLSSLANFKPIIEYCGGTEIGGGYISSVVDKPNFAAAFNTPAIGLDLVLIEDSDSDSDPVNSSTKTKLAKASDEGEVFLIPPSIGLSNRLVNRDHHETYYARTPVVEGITQLRRHGDYFRSIDTPEGKIFVAGGRIDDTMNLGGIKVSSAEIERVLNQCERVIETAAIAESQSDGPDQLIVFAVCDGKLASSEEAQLKTRMNERLKSELNPLFRVARLSIVEGLPRTASGKVMRRLLRDQNS